MANRRKRMAVEDRAKQFMPFAALKGLEEALQEKEKIVVKKMELTEDMQEQLNWKLKQLMVQDIVTVVYYHKGEYLRITGMVSRVDVSSRILQIVHTKISLDDIYDVQIEKRLEERP